MSLAAGWLAETGRTYFGNAASRRDFRVQMRGAKPFWVFTLYVAALSLIGISVYWASIGRNGLSLSMAQSELSNFFTSLMALLGGAICLIAPALTATTIVSERQRQSLDLVMSAPIAPKYLLVGKMLSGYRYTWMLLILALPIVAMSVVLGGATWRDVFGCFALLSFHALVFTSLSLLISSFSQKPAAAVVYSFFAIMIYVSVTATISASVLPTVLLSGSRHASFVIALNPFTALQAVNSSTQIGSTEVPNWILGGVASLLVTRLFLLGAAVNLAPLDRKLSANFRISGLIYTFGLGLLIVYSVGQALRLLRPGHQDDSMMLINFGLVSVAWLTIVSPVLSCYGWEGSRRFWPNGQFSLRHIFDGTPAGNLPYQLALAASSLLGAFVAYRWSGGGSHLKAFPQVLLWPLGFLVFIWSLGQVLSAANKSMRTARSLHTVLLVVGYTALPILMSMLQLNPPWARAYDTGSSRLWYLWPFAPLTDNDLLRVAWLYGLVMLGLGIALAGWARSIERARTRRVLYG